MNDLRENQLIQVLIDSNQFVSAQELAKKLRVSEKTIYRDIKGIEEKNTQQESLILKTPGKGYKINYSIFLKEETTFSLVKNVGMKDLDRKNQILLELLYKAPNATSVVKLAEKFYVSATSIVNDLKIIERELDYFNLCLTKNSSGTFVTGDEKNIRKMLVSLTNQYLPYESKWIFSEGGTKVNTENLDLFLKRFSREDIQFIQRIMNAIENKLNFDLENPYYINLFSHLLILTKRVGDGAVIEEVTSVEKSTIDLHILKIALEVIQDIESYIQIKLSYSEVEYVYLYLTSAGGQKDISYKVNIDSDEQSLSNQLVKGLLREISEKTHLNLMKNRYLKQQLIQHFKPMLKRIMYEIQIKNQLLDDIKNEFADLFDKVKSVMESLCEKHHISHITDDEVGYIVLYIQNAIELEEQNKNVLIVCSTGIGTSHLLKTRVAKSFPAWNIIDVISAKEVSDFEERDDIDLVLSTVNIESLSLKTVIVSSLFNEKDKEIVLKELSN